MPPFTLAAPTSWDASAATRRPSPPTAVGSSSAAIPSTRPFCSAGWQSSKKTSNRPFPSVVRVKAASGAARDEEAADEVHGVLDQRWDLHGGRHTGADEG